MISLSLALMVRHFVSSRLAKAVVEKQERFLFLAHHSIFSGCVRLPQNVKEKENTVVSGLLLRAGPLCRVGGLNASRFT